MKRAIFVPVLASVAFACLLATGASAGPTGGAALAPQGTRSAAEDPGVITLRVRYAHRAWKRSLSLKLVKTKLISFALCSIRNWEPGQRYECDFDRGARLPSGMIMRLEQNPIGKALKRDDSPGWGMLGLSTTGRLGAVLSNTVTGDKFGIFRYRVTLRDTSSGQVLATSNSITVNWHR